MHMNLAMIRQCEDIGLADRDYLLSSFNEWKYWGLRGEMTCSRSYSLWVDPHLLVCSSYCTHYHDMCAQCPLEQISTTVEATLLDVNGVRVVRINTKSENSNLLSLIRQQGAKTWQAWASWKHIHTLIKPVRLSRLTVNSLGLVGRAPFSPETRLTPLLYTP